MINNGFPLSFMEELKSKNDIVSVISRYVTLDRKGRLYWGRCPFHGERTPSFAVNDTDGYYHCFGCKESGDVIKFIEKIENVDFLDAIKILADWAHMEVPELSGSSDKTEALKKKKERLLALMKDTAMYYHKNLASPKASEGLEYFERRGIDNKSITKFGLGYSFGYTEVIEYLKSKGYTISEMLESGTVKEKDGRYYDAIGGRVVFPIINEYSEVVGFGGRTLLKKVDFAKYLNTAETFLFNKKKILYGFNVIKNNKRKDPSINISSIIVVEGYMDVISLHSAGFSNAVASMGTALTPEQAKLIKRFTENVIICYDGDFAGQKATIRGLEILKNASEFNIKVVSLPSGLDPDDVIKQNGKEAFQNLLDTALPLTEFKLNYVKKLYDLTTSDGKTRYLEHAIKILKGLPSVIERESYIELLREETHTNRDFLRKLLNEESKPEQKIERKESEEDKKGVTLIIDSALDRAEKFILSSLLNKKNYATNSKRLPEYTLGEIYTRMAEFITSSYSKPESELKTEFIDRFEQDHAGEVGEILNYLTEEQSDEQAKKYYDDCLWVLYKNYIERKMENINKKIDTVASTDERRAMLIELATLTKKIQSKKVE
ncbi:MAG: DNA primase [Clostridia bacterium]